MQSFTLFMAAFVGLWLLQILFTVWQAKHYRRQLQMMGNRESGYLGVGVHRRRLGPGAVVILVTDSEGRVTDGKMMAGMTVWARFRRIPELMGKRLEDCRVKAPTTAKHFALNMAIDKINEERAGQMMKQCG
ncbi:MAG: transcriptional regulator GutM [Planifilum fulgidum]